MIRFLFFMLIVNYYNINKTQQHFLNIEYVLLHFFVIL